METVKKSGVRGMNKQSTEDFEGSKNTLHDTIMIDNTSYLPKPMACTTKVNPNVNYGLWVMMM